MYYVAQSGIHFDFIYYVVQKKETNFHQRRKHIVLWSFAENEFNFLQRENEVYYEA